ncbi:nurim [Anaeramoeba flamelloides]|uniref:Nurim n=1 Tax=Anaeramoeba flamelloides TaxID=1746091 RepID=A0ABQ8YC83_9EUKA|nr:nurim [Anaeramoeba flamelloides]
MALGLNFINKTLTILIFSFALFLCYNLFHFLTPSSAIMKLPFIILNPYKIMSKYLTTTKRVLFWDVLLLLLFLGNQLLLLTNSFKFLLPRSFRKNQFLKKVATFFGLLNFYALISCWIPLDPQMASPIWQLQSPFWFKMMFIVGWIFVFIQLPLYYSATLFDFSKTFQRLFRSGAPDQTNPLQTILLQDNSPIFFGPVLILFAAKIMSIDRILFAGSIALYLLTSSFSTSEEIKNGQKFMLSSIQYLWNKNPYSLYNQRIKKKKY